MMPRMRFGAGLNDWVYHIVDDVNVELLPGTDVTFWSDRFTGTQYSIRVFDPDTETFIDANSAEVDEKGRIPLIEGPDFSTTVSSMWAEAGAGPRFLIVSYEVQGSVQERLSDIEAVVVELDPSALDTQLTGLESDQSTLTTDLNTAVTAINTEQTRANTILDTPRPNHLVFAARREATQSIATSTLTQLQWDTIIKNDNAWNGLNPADIVIPYTGVYEIRFFFAFSSDSSGSFRTGYLTVDGVPQNATRVIDRWMHTDRNVVGPRSPSVLSLTQGDVLNLRVEHDATTSIDIDAETRTYARISVAYLEAS